MSDKSIRTAGPLEAAKAFQFKGPIVSIKPHGNGRINKTFRVVSKCAGIRLQWILQRLNQEVLPDLEAVTSNIVTVTQHLGQKREEADKPHSLLTPILTKNGGYLHQTQAGHAWRGFAWINGVAYETVDSLEVAYEAARAVAQFHADLVGYTGPPLAVTIPDFHHTAKRLEQLEKAVAADSCQRSGRVAKELAVIDANRHLAETIPFKNLPQRIVHNDPKLNNILFNMHTHEALCLIDFDTVMPGTILHDIGDMVRSMTNRGGEGTQPTTVFFDDKIYGAIEKGYLSVMGDTLETVERELLPLTGQVLAFELGVRFLTDYLDGDHYFAVTHSSDNLNRCRVQLALLKSMQAKLPV